MTHNGLLGTGKGLLATVNQWLSNKNILLVTGNDLLFTQNKLLPTGNGLRSTAGHLLLTSNQQRSRVGCRPGTQYLDDPRPNPRMSTANELPLITPEAALHKMRAGEALRGYHIRGTIDLRELAADDTYVTVPVRIEGCRLDHLDAILLQLECPVVLRRVLIGRADFYAAYFRQGLLLEECDVAGYLDFQSGGHNKPGFPVRLLGNTFHGFVNFFDCWYEAEVEVTGNDFRQGTNLLGRPENIPVTFAVPPLLLDNLGRLDHEDEGPAQPT